MATVDIDLGGYQLGWRDDDVALAFEPRKGLDEDVIRDMSAMKREPEWRLTGYGNATNYGANKLRFVSPVPAGSKIHSRGRLVGVEAHPKGTQVTQEINVHVVGSDRPALIYEMVVLYHPPMKRS